MDWIRWLAPNRMALFEEARTAGNPLSSSPATYSTKSTASPDRVVLITGGYLQLPKAIFGRCGRRVREKPMQVLVRCAGDHPEALASKMFAMNHCVEARIHPDGKGIFLRTGDVDQFLIPILNDIASRASEDREAVAPADDDANATLPVPHRF